jgi:hypothetical protein
MSEASSSSRFLYSFETFKGWRGVLWLPDHIGGHNLDSVQSGLCPRGGEAAINDFSVGHNLPIPARRTVPGDSIRKCAFLSHHAEDLASCRSGLILPKSSQSMSVSGQRNFFVVRSGRYAIRALRDLCLEIVLQRLENHWPSRQGNLESPGTPGAFFRSET